MFLTGGDGSDTASFADSNSAVTVALTPGTGTATGDGNDTLFQIENVTGSDFDDIITGGSTVNILAGGAGNDIINADDDDDILNGNDGDDVLNGERGDDTIFGDAGDDIINGGRGDDTMTGGDGQDTFVFDDFASTTDTITDFSITGVEDIIDLTLFRYQFRNFGEIEEQFSQVGNNTEIDLGDGQTIILENVMADSLVADNFIFYQSTKGGADPTGEIDPIDPGVTYTGNDQMPLSPIIRPAGYIKGLSELIETENPYDGAIQSFIADTSAPNTLGQPAAQTGRSSGSLDIHQDNDLTVVTHEGLI